MTDLKTIRLVVPVISLLVALTACSTGDEPAAEDDQSATSTAPTTATAAPSTTTGAVTSAAPSTATTGNDATVVPTLAELREDLGIETLVLEPTTESGSHPTLRWQPADGATSYWLTVRDAADTPYWAWTGTETSVRVGGGDNSDTNQTAVLHETMTWRVTAFDSSGGLIAISEEATVSP